MHLASRLGVKNDKSFQTAYWKAFNDFFGPTNAPVIKAMLIARHVKVDTGNADLDRVCFGLRETMSWLAEAIERKALESVGQSVPRSSGGPPPARSPGKKGKSGR
ncbi:MAG TPA: hypothetical protein VEM77_11270 [Thermoplasmata archaeon]|nr:hypothetical protein [Thermoplasmata archaeon]